MHIDDFFSTFLVISPSKLNKMVKFLNGQELFVSCQRLYLWNLSLSIQNSHLFLIAAILRFNMAQKKITESGPIPLMFIFLIGGDWVAQKVKDDHYGSFMFIPYG